MTTTIMEIEFQWISLEVNLNKINDFFWIIFVHLYFIDDIVAFLGLFAMTDYYLVLIWELGALAIAWLLIFVFLD